MSEINDAVQVLRVTFEGGELIFKVSSAALEELKKLIKILFSVVHKEKVLGKTSMKKLLNRGGDLHVFQFESKDLKKVKRLAKKYGILYSLLPDVNKKDNMSEFVFHIESTERVNSLIAKLNKGKIITLDDYIKNGETEEIAKVEDEFDKIQEENKEVKLSEEKEAEKEKEELKKSEEPETVSEIKSINENIQDGKSYLSREELESLPVTERIKILDRYKDDNFLDVTIARKLVVRETKDNLLMRIPFEKDKYFWMNKADLWWFNDGKTLLGFLKKDVDYKVYASKGTMLESIKGKDLYSNHYDKVSPAVREKIERIEKAKEAAKNRKIQTKEQQIKQRPIQTKSTKVMQNRRK